MTPRIHPTPARAPAVVADPPHDAVGWAPLVGEVGRALGVEPTVEMLPDGDGRDRAVDGLLIRVSRGARPVLVLPLWSARPPPRRAAPTGVAPTRVAPTGVAATGVAGRRPEGDGSQPVMQRVLIASDASEEVAGAATALAGRFAAVGVYTIILHVLTDDNRPRMWEGAGHHAAVWFDELSRRHGTTADVVRVTAGEPGDALRAHAVGADLVVMLWRAQLAPGRAATVRSVLRAGVEIPHLLVPLEWMATLESVPKPEVQRRRTDR